MAKEGKILLKRLCNKSPYFVAELVDVSNYINLIRMRNVANVKYRRNVSKYDDKSSSFLPSIMSNKINTKSDFLNDSGYYKSKMEILLNTSFSSDEHNIYSPRFSDMEDNDDDGFIDEMRKKNRELSIAWQFND